MGVRYSDIVVHYSAYAGGPFIHFIESSKYGSVTWHYSPAQCSYIILNNFIRFKGVKREDSAKFATKLSPINPEDMMKEPDYPEYTVDDAIELVGLGRLVVCRGLLVLAPVGSHKGFTPITRQVLERVEPFKHLAGTFLFLDVVK